MIFLIILIIFGIFTIIKICNKDDYDDVYTNFVISKTKSGSTLKPKNNKIYVNGRWLNINQANIDDYDDKGNIVHRKLNGEEIWYKYDEKNNCIYKKHSDGKEIWYKYDEKNRCIYEKHSDGKEIWYKYDEKNNCIYKKHSDGKESWKEYDYINHIATCKCTNKKEEFKDYANDANYVIRREYADGYILWRDYDEKNRVIHTVDTEQCEKWFEYDVNDNLIRQIVHDGNETHEWYGKYNVLGLLEQSMSTDYNNYRNEYEFEHFFDGIKYDDSTLIYTEINDNDEKSFFKLDENNNKIYIKQVIKYLL